jgi:probable HAF family extracellular repeat protein
MFRHAKRMGRWLAIAVAIGLFASAAAWAGNPDKPDKPGGGGGGGGGGGTTTQYTLVDLLGLPGDPEGDLQSEAVAVNDPDAAGGVFVVGNSHVDGSVRAAFWSVDGDGSFTIDDLNNPPFLPTDVNNDGVITARSARVLVPGHPWQELPRFGSSATALAVNNLGAIVGSDGAGRSSQGALWQLDAEGVPGDPIYLGDFFPIDIDDLGVMAGSQNGIAAVAWFNSADSLQVMPLGLLAGYDVTQASAISSDAQWVCGTAQAPGKGDEAFVWSAETGMIGLGTLGGKASEAMGVNSAGEVVGFSFTKSGDQRAFLWKDGQMFNLNDLADVGGHNYLAVAEDINDAGDVIGVIRIWRPVSEVHGFLLMRNAP